MHSIAGIVAGLMTLTIIVLITTWPLPPEVDEQRAMFINMCHHGGGSLSESKRGETTEYLYCTYPTGLAFLYRGKYQFLENTNQ